MQKLINSLGLLLLGLAIQPLAANEYPWLEYYDGNNAIAWRIAAPEGFHRVDTEAGSFADWLRHLPLKPEGSPVMLYDGRPKENTTAHYAVIDIDTGHKDLQQCADAVMRLRAEYLYSLRRYDKIHFNFTSGDNARYLSWKTGYRPIVRGNDVTWRNQAAPDGSYAEFRRYLDTVFNYAGTYSLSQELPRKHNLQDIAIGDVFIKGGFPGHAVLVVDLVQHPDTGEKRFLLAQSYMPAQDVHVLKNPLAPTELPWYQLPTGKSLYTPEWDFKPTELRQFAPLPEAVRISHTD